MRRLILPLNRPIVRDLIDQNTGAPDEGAVFAFQAPPGEGHPLDHAGSDGHSGDMVSVTVPKPSILKWDSQTGTSDSRGNFFEDTHNESIDFRENTFVGLRPVPFSTPGPGCAIPRAPAARYSREGSPMLSHTTDEGSQDVMDVPPPFSTPGPFASPRPARSRLFGSHPVAPHMLLDEDYPTSQKSSAVSFLSSYFTKSDRIDVPLFPVQDGCGPFSALSNLGFTSNNSGGLLFTPGSSLLAPVFIP